MTIMIRRLTLLTAASLVWAGFVGWAATGTAAPPAAPKSILAPVPLAEDDQGSREELPAYDWQDDDYELFPPSAMACYDGCVADSPSEPVCAAPIGCPPRCACRCRHRKKTHDLFGGVPKLFVQFTDFVERCADHLHGCCESCCHQPRGSCCEPDCGAG
jgi:hypothetical protein